MGLRLDFDTYGDELVSHELLGMSLNARDPAPVLHDIADDLRRMETLLFASEDAWAPLAESTLAEKARLGYPSEILHRTLALRDSLGKPGNPGGFSIVTHDSLYFGTSVDYARYHKTGTRFMPKRDPLPITELDRRRWSKMVQRFIVEGERALYGLPPGGDRLSIFGPLIDASEVENEMLAFLRRWMPTYVAEVVRQKQAREPGLWPNGVAAVRNFSVVHAAEEKWPEDQLPMILAYSPGILEPARKQGDGNVTAKYQLGVSAIASGNTLEATKMLTRVYATAAKAAILQHESLDGFALGTEWIDERNFPIVQGVEVERNLLAVSALYIVEVEAVLNRDEGPLEPLEEPDTEPPEWPHVREDGGKVAVVQTSGEFEDVDPEEGFP